MILLSYIIVVVSIIFALFVSYQVTMRYINIKNLDETNLKNKEKKDYLKALRKYAQISAIAIIFDIVALITKFLEFRLIVAVIVIIILSSLYNDLLDEIADFDTTKKDSDILKEYFNMITEDSKSKVKDSKVKKIDSTDISKVENKNENNN
jgi:hypothetical protein